jgi:hypothetical protein
MEPARAYPHVTGQSLRVKAEPTRLTLLAARVMCASGNFTTEHSPARSNAGLFIGAVMVALAAGTLAVAGGPSVQPARVDASLLAVSDQVFALGLSEYVPPAAAPAQATDARDAQDRFEIARFFRLTAAANQALAPAAGPPRRAGRGASR